MTKKPSPDSQGTVPVAVNVLGTIPNWAAILVAIGCLTALFSFVAVWLSSGPIPILALAAGMLAAGFGLFVSERAVERSRRR
jgi:hypothetical protein